MSDDGDSKNQGEKTDRKFVADREALDRMYLVIYEQLKAEASRQRKFRGVNQIHTTSIVHESWARMAKASPHSARTPYEFKRFAAKTIRDIVISAHRKANPKKYKPPVLTTLDAEDLVGGLTCIKSARLLDFDRSLDKLTQRYPRAAEVLICVFYGGMTHEETAQALGIATSTVDRDIRLARPWLSKAMGEEEQNSTESSRGSQHSE